jgi:hypothetical protein
MKSVFWIALIALLTLAIRGHNLRSTFIDGRIYFVDADCYSRMTRAQIVDEHLGTIVRYHDFENHPIGVAPHTTAVLDYLIVGFKGVLWLLSRPFEALRSSVLASQLLDAAGALISPILGLLTVVVLSLWGRWWMRRRTTGGAIEPPMRMWLAAAPPLLFAVSPILVHGTALGRPDHQSLLILLTAFALGAEWILAGRYLRGWAIVAGLAWGVALWVSVYEPFILLAAISFFRWVEVMFFSKADAVPSAKILPWKWGTIAVIVLLAVLIERWHFQLPDDTLKAYFNNWAISIGELRHLDPSKPTLYRWLSWLCVISPILLVLAARQDRRAISALGMLVVTFALTCWQIRWGYFLALVFAMTLPWQLSVLRTRWIAWPLLLIALWPTWKEWDEQLYPDAQAQKQFGLRRMELTQMRAVAEAMRSHESHGFLAPWWQSPPLAYWSRQSGVAGSSHESLAGIVDTARFYTAADPEVAAKILQDRRVSWVVVDDPGRLISTSRSVLGSELPANLLVTTLAEQPGAAPSYLTETPIPAADPSRPQFFRLYRVHLERTDP